MSIEEHENRKHKNRMKEEQNGNIFCMEKLDPRLAAIIILLYVRYLPGMMWDKMCMEKKKYWKNGDGAEIPDGGSLK